MKLRIPVTLREGQSVDKRSRTIHKHSLGVHHSHGFYVQTLDLNGGSHESGLKLRDRVVEQVIVHENAHTYAIGAGGYERLREQCLGCVVGERCNERGIELKLK